MTEPRYAVVGSGVSGLVAAYVLSGAGPVTIYEADARPGGHAHTHDVTLPGGQVVPVDSGFIVHNDRTYPTLCRLFSELDVATQPTDMSMSVSGGPRRWQYAGGQGARGILGDPRTAASPAYWRMLGEVRRFHREARNLLAHKETRGGGLDTGSASAPPYSTSSGAPPYSTSTDVTIGEWAGGLGFSDTFHQMFLRPLVAAVWSCDTADALRYPARSLLTFLEHHGMLTVTGSPTWRTVVGGSRSYVDRVLKNVSEIRLSSPVREVRRTDDGVEVTDPHGTRTYAGVVIATHPHQALRMLHRPDALEEAVLSAITYSTNPAQLHTDTSLLPTRRRVRASWNYRLPDDEQQGVLVTYDLTRLMRLPRGDEQRVLVTLNGSHRVDPSTVIAEMTYEHPLYTAEAVAAQRLLPQLSDDRIAFAGAYHGWGFHEDGAASGLAAARRLGVSW